MVVKGIDVSSFQGSIDWAKVRASGVEFAIIRAVRETGEVDPTFVANVARARAAGVVPGAYCFLNEGSAGPQAWAFRTVVDEVGASGLLLALDVERGAGVVPPLADIATWLGVVRDRYPTRPIFLYGSPGVITDALGNLGAYGPWWMADYRNGANPAGPWDAAYAVAGGDASTRWASTGNGWRRATLWQFSSRGSVPGIAGAVDLTAMHGSLAAFAGLPSPIDPTTADGLRVAGARAEWDREFGPAGAAKITPAPRP